jgi:hypothetical protein
MVFKCQTFLISVLFFLVSCQPKNEGPDPYLSDSAGIQTAIQTGFSASTIDTLITCGLYNLAFESITTNRIKITKNQVLAFANRFIENGEFDKGLSLANSARDPNNAHSVLILQLSAALNKMDTLQSQVLMDSLLTIGKQKKGQIEPIELLLAQSYLAHNRKDFQQAIALNLKAIEMIRSNHLSDDLLAKAYHRIGNDYNDIVRDNVDFPLNKKTCLQNTIKYYKKELDVLLRSRVKNEARIALNYITTGMVLRGRASNDSVITYYKKALSFLILRNTADFIQTRHPIYTSIALTHLGGLYFDKQQQSKMDSVFDINRKLIQIRSLYKVDEKQSLDVFEYFPQRSQEMKILYQLANPTKASSLQSNILELSNSCKYANLKLTRQLHQLFGEDYNLAVKNWILLNELDLYAHLQGQPLVKFNALKKLQYYNQLISRLHLNALKKISQKDLSFLHNFCKTKNTTIIDYQVLFGGSISIVKIEPTGISLEWVRTNSEQLRSDVRDLVLASKNNQVDIYTKIAASLSETLGLKKILTNKIIICPDDYLEKLPFDALVSNVEVGKAWSDCKFIGKLHEVRIIPNLLGLFELSIGRSALNIDIWSSDHDNATLPYNQKLIDHLVEMYDAKLNEDLPEQILHVLAHTYRSASNQIEFRLNKDTLTVYKSGFIHPKLVVLEGCSSGEGHYLKSEGSITQTRSFIYNGTESVIYSIWDADNQASSTLFNYFYKELSTGSTSSEALHKAKKQLISDVLHPEWSNPYYWANFQLTGQDLRFVN